MGFMSQPGPATDAAGQNVIDPTANVYALFKAGMDEQSRLREKDAEHFRELLGTFREQSEMFRDHILAIMNRESARVDSIRAVDVAAVQRTAEVQENRAVALATQVQATADAFAKALAAALEPLHVSVAELQRALYQQQGVKETTSETTQATRAQGANVGMWVGIMVAVLGTLAGAFMSVLAIGVTLYLASR